MHKPKILKHEKFEIVSRCGGVEVHMIAQSLTPAEAAQQRARAVRGSQKGLGTMSQPSSDERSPIADKGARRLTVAKHPVCRTCAHCDTGREICIEPLWCDRNWHDGATVALSIFVDTDYCSNHSELKRDGQ